MIAFLAFLKGAIWLLMCLAAVIGLTILLTPDGPPGKNFAFIAGIMSAIVCLMIAIAVVLTR